MIGCMANGSFRFHSVCGRFHARDLLFAQTG